MSYLSGSEALLYDLAITLDRDALRRFAEHLRRHNPRLADAFFNALYESRANVSKNLLVFDTKELVASGCQMFIRMAPDDIFKPTRLEIIATDAPYFTLDEMRIGAITQLYMGGPWTPIPCDASAFQEDNAYQWDFDTVQANMDVRLTVTNQSPIGHRFRAVLYGVTLKPGSMNLPVPTYIQYAQTGVSTANDARAIADALRVERVGDETIKDVRDDMEAAELLNPHERNDY